MSYQDYFSACSDRGRAGEEYLLSELEGRLQPFGLVVRRTAIDNERAPFDLEVLDGHEVLVGIENKDLAPATQGTWIKRSRKKRKLAYAQDHSIRLVLTTVTLRDAGRIGFKEGIVNGAPVLFDYDVDRLIERIVATKEGPT